MVANASCGRRGRATSSPPQLGHRPFSVISAQAAQNVHSNEHIRASVDSGARSYPQHSQLGLSSSIAMTSPDKCNAEPGDHLCFRARYTINTAAKMMNRPSSLGAMRYLQATSLRSRHHQRSSLRITSCKPDQVSLTAQTFTSTNPIGRTIDRMASSLTSDGTFEAFLGHDIHTAELGLIPLRSDLSLFSRVATLSMNSCVTSTRGESFATKMTPIGIGVNILR